MERFFGNHEKQDFDAIVILGSGMNTTVDGRTKLSWTTRMRLKAAEKLHKENPTARLITTGGKVYPGFDDLSEQGKGRLVYIYNIPHQLINCIGGTNTIYEFNLIGRLINEKKIDPINVVIISNHFHMVAKSIAVTDGMNFVSAEKILGNIDKRYKRIVNGIMLSKTYVSLFFNQILGSLILRLPYGKEIYLNLDRRVKKGIVPEPFDPYGLQKL